MEALVFHPVQPVLTVGLWQALKKMRGNDGPCEGAAFWLFLKFTKICRAGSLPECICSMLGRDILTPKMETDKVLPGRKPSIWGISRNGHFSKSECEVFPCVRVANMWLLDLRNDHWLSTRKYRHVHGENDFKSIFSNELPQSTTNGMISYWRTYNSVLRRESVIHSTSSAEAQISSEQWDQPRLHLNIRFKPTNSDLRRCRKWISKFFSWNNTSPRWWKNRSIVDLTAVLATGSTEHIGDVYNALFGRVG